MAPGKHHRPTSSSAQSGLFPALPTSPIAQRAVRRWRCSRCEQPVRGGRVRTPAVLNPLTTIAASVPTALEPLSVWFQPTSKPLLQCSRGAVCACSAQCFRRHQTATATVQTTARSASRSTAGFYRGGFCRAATKQPASSGRTDGGNARAASIPAPEVAMLALRTSPPTR